MGKDLSEVWNTTYQDTTTDFTTSVAKGFIDVPNARQVTHFSAWRGMRGMRELSLRLSISSGVSTALVTPSLEA